MAWWSLANHGPTLPQSNWPTTHVCLANFHASFSRVLGECLQNRRCTTGLCRYLPQREPIRSQTCSTPSHGLVDHASPTDPLALCTSALLASDDSLSDNFPFELGEHTRESLSEFRSRSTLHAVPLQCIDELRDVMFYSSKLLKQPASVLGGLSKKLWEPRELPDEPRKSLSDIDLYTVLPKAKSEPVYVKSDLERELDTALKETRSLGEV
jgi:hypothetical protein